MKKFGTGLLVTAAFIGPGTVTTASVAGSQFGFALVWALIISVVATYVLQEMASRLGIVTGKGLAEGISDCLPTNIKLPTIALVIAAIGIGNAAYQAGNLTGAGLGISSILGGSIALWACALGALAAVVLWLGKYVLLERVLISLVIVMAFVFVTTAMIAAPSMDLLASFTFSLPDRSTLIIMALIGTTVVPYNLFLHASIVAQQRQHNSTIDNSIAQNRLDAGLSIGLGGLVTLAIMSCAATAFFATNTPMQVQNIAQQLTPLLGQHAELFFAIGLFSAGLTSAITAPLAAAYAVCGALGWPNDLKSFKFKGVWLIVLIVGTIFASIGIKPIAAIVFAQAANGLLLPIIAIFLLWVVNQTSVMGQHVNGKLGNFVGGSFVIFVTLLGTYKLIGVI